MYLIFAVYAEVGNINIRLYFFIMKSTLKVHIFQGFRKKMLIGLMFKSCVNFDIYFL